MITCDHCEKVFSSHGKFQRHKNAITRESMFITRPDREPFSLYESAKTHPLKLGGKEVYERHSDKFFHCRQCDFRHDDSEVMHNHLKKHKNIAAQDNRYGNYIKIDKRLTKKELL
jgi:hypothetical protein